MKVTACIAVLAVGLLLGGCFNTGAKHRPIVDGSDPEKYEADLADCQALARQREHMNEDVKLETAKSAAVGGVLGAVAEGVPGAIAGAVVGAGGGAVQGAEVTVRERKSIVIRCMAGRGHKVLEPAWF